MRESAVVIRKMINQLVVGPLSPESVVWEAVGLASFPFFSTTLDVGVEVVDGEHKVKYTPQPQMR